MKIIRYGYKAEYETLTEGIDNYGGPLGLCDTREEAELDMKHELKSLETLGFELEPFEIFEYEFDLREELENAENYLM